MIEIPLNDYKEDTSVREDVVQKICNVLLSGKEWHPKTVSPARTSNNELLGSVKAPGKFYDFGGAYWHQYKSEHTFLQFNEAEMRRAFKEILGAGYHIFRYLQYGTYPTYEVSKKPYFWKDGADSVRDFTERWT